MSANLMRANGSYITITLSIRRLNFYEGGRLVKSYPVGVGKPSTPTPTGTFRIREKVMHPGGALGTRWMGLSIPGGNYGIHGTNNPPSIGGYVSNGCIRMYNHDVEELFPKVMIGTVVEISSGTGQTKAEGLQGTLQGGKRSHTVQAGESLWEIAQRYGQSLDSIITANQLANPDMIYPGQVIIIPG
jgi:hypothetical protein